MKKLFILLSFTFSLFSEDTFVNPITDICWECVFPLKIAGIESNSSPLSSSHISEKASQNSLSDRFCFCHGLPPRPGIPISFWEPKTMIDVTKEAYKMVAFGGIFFGSPSIKNRGVLKEKYSFSHVHVYDYPIFAMLEVLTDFACIEKGDVDLAYFSELDYSWYDDSLSNILNPEVALFANPLAQAACMADCATSSSKKPLDSLFWCGGCHGSVYPLSGAVGAHVGPIQEALLLSQRAVAKMHRTGFLMGYEEGNYCKKSYFPIWQKSQYKAQLASPISITKGECPSLGGTEVLWGAGKSYPGKGEEFVFVLWSQRKCCLDVVKLAAQASGGGVSP